jgi:hypothetical protein
MVRCVNCRKIFNGFPGATLCDKCLKIQCDRCRYPLANCQCPPPPPIKPLSGWQCPTCRRVWAPFVDRCIECQPRRSYEVLDGFIPGKKSTTLQHGMVVTLPSAERCERCGGPLPLSPGGAVYETETGHVCENCTTTRRSGCGDES